MQNDPNRRVIAALLYAFGQPKGGAYEVRIPNHILSSLPPLHTLEQEPSTTHLVLRLRPTVTIRGEWAEVPETPAEPLAPLPAPETPHIDEYA